MINREFMKEWKKFRNRPEQNGKKLPFLKKEV